MPTVKSGFRIDATKLQKKLVELGKIRASQFKQELVDGFTRKSLKSASKATPVRDLSLIRTNQQRQYKHRINYIPSYHELLDPSLRVKEDGTHWFFIGGKWYNGNQRMPDDAWAAAEQLIMERGRRMADSQSEFIAERAQARYLYKKSWSQVASSLGCPFAVAGAVENSHSRHEPSKEPNRGYGQIRGGEKVLTVVIYNPFLEEENPKYKPWSGAEILKDAMEQNRPQFNKAVERKLSRICYAITHAN